MNLIGKILTVVILVMSLVFMAMILSIYATHVNWKKAYEDKKASFDKEVAEKFSIGLAQLECLYVGACIRRQGLADGELLHKINRSLSVEATGTVHAHGIWSIHDFR